MWNLFNDYINHAKNNPIFKREYVGKDGMEVDTPLAVPITFEGFECYLSEKNIINDLGDYMANTDGSYDAYKPVMKRIGNYCFVNNFNGAAVGVLKEALISRKLGLKDHKDTVITSNVSILNIDPLSDGNTTNNSSKENSGAKETY